jgi:hypothetical protein
MEDIPSLYKKYSYSFSMCGEEHAPPMFNEQKSLLTIFDNQKGKIWENIF